MSGGLALICVVLFIWTARVATIESSNALKAPSGTPILLGERGNKKYYSVNSLASWYESLEYCHQNLLNSIQIETQQELEYVGSILRKKSWRYNYFWTSGHDFFSDGNFKWMKTNKLIDRRLNNLFGNSTRPRTYNCVQLSLRSSDVNVLFDFTCTDSNVQPLCETA